MLIFRFNSVSDPYSMTRSSCISLTVFMVFTMLFINHVVFSLNPHISESGERVRAFLCLSEHSIKFIY